MTRCLCLCRVQGRHYRARAPQPITEDHWPIRHVALTSTSLRVNFSNSRALRSSGCTMTPPLAPPNGTSITAHFQVLMEARLQAGQQIPTCRSFGRCSGAQCLTPPLAPPKGTSMTAHFHVLMEARLQSGCNSAQFEHDRQYTGACRCSRCSHSGWHIHLQVLRETRRQVAEQMQQRAV
jgi:hypothetical protein